MRCCLAATLLCAACGGVTGFAPAPATSRHPTRLSAKKGKKAAAATPSGKISLRGFGGTVPKPPAPTADSLASSAATQQGTLLRDAETQALSRWFDTAGLDMRKVAVADFGGLRGGMLLEDVKQGQCIMEVPVKAAIDLGDQGSDPTLPALELLKVWSNPDSRWRPYLDSLPQPGSVELTTTDFFSDEELSMLQWPPVVEETRRRMQMCERLYNDVIKVQMEMGTAFHGKHITLDDLKWAVYMVVSRALTVTRGDSMTMAKLLIPGIDLLNHDGSSPHVLTGRAVAGGTLKILAGMDLKAGSQVAYIYSGGAPRSDRFLQDYGFLDTEGCAKQDALVLASSLGKRHQRELGATTIEQDEQLLAGGTLGRRAGLAVQFRLSLKRILAEQQQ